MALAIASPGGQHARDARLSVARLPLGLVHDLPRMHARIGRIPSEQRGQYVDERLALGAVLPPLVRRRVVVGAAEQNEVVADVVLRGLVQCRVKIRVDAGIEPRRRTRGVALDLRATAFEYPPTKNVHS